MSNLWSFVLGWLVGELRNNHQKIGNFIADELEKYKDVNKNG